MNKTDREYFENRVQEIVRCTNGTVATILNDTKQDVELPAIEKFKFIKDNKATLKPQHELIKESGSYNSNAFDNILKCYTYPLTATQTKAIAFNKKVEAKTETIMQEITLEGKRIVDRAVFGLLASQDIPNELHKLAEMVNLART